MFDYMLYFFVPWPIVNLFFLVNSLIKEEDIGFVFYVRWFFRIEGPYDLVLSDFFSRFVSSVIVLVGIVAVSLIWLWFYTL